MEINSYRLKQLIENGSVKKVIPLPKYNPLYLVGETFWCGYWQKYYKVLDANYSPYLIKGKVFMRLDSVTVEWEDGRHSTHCTELNPTRDFRLIIKEKK